MKRLHGSGFRFMCFAFAVLSFLFCSVLHGQQNDPGKKDAGEQPQVKVPPAKTVDFLRNNVAIARQVGEPLAITQTIGELINRLGEEQFAEADAYFVSQDFPSMRQLFTDARINMVETGNAEAATDMTLKEAKIVLPVLQQRIDAILQDFDRHKMLHHTSPVQADWETYEQTFWDIHVFRNQLHNALGLSNFAHKINLPLRGQAQRTGQQTAVAPNQQQSTPVFAVDYSQLSQSIEQRMRHLEQRDIELRLYRIEDVDAAFANRHLDPESRIRAAFALAFDMPKLDQFFRTIKENKQVAAQITLKSLLKEGLSDEVAQIVKRATENAKSDMYKARLLYVGMHYWMRGRFGAGPEAWGLLKDRQAMASPEAMFPLFMPTQPQAATDPMQPSLHKSPQIDRRHLYAWAAEYRPFSTTLGGSNSRQVDQKTLTNTTVQSAGRSFW